MQQHTQRSPRTSTQRCDPDPRWHALNIVLAAKEPLGLSDRDLAVLRGLLTFIPADSWHGALDVFASNAALQKRCDGIDERTLRRRLARLCELGLITRNQSPNRKRYVIRDETGATLLAYGFNLRPLRDNLRHLRDIGDAHARTLLRIRALRAILRDKLYKLSASGFRPETHTDELAGFQKLLRRKTTAPTLESAIRAVETISTSPDCASPDATETKEMTDSVGQIDRHIQSSNIDLYEKTAIAPVPKEAEQALVEPQITLHDCIAAARSPMSFAQTQPKNWADIEDLAHQLAPAIGIDKRQMLRTTQLLGNRGATLAILGLVEAYPRIREPNRYLNSLLARASTVGLNMGRMFRSLTGWNRFPAGNPTPGAA